MNLLPAASPCTQRVLKKCESLDTRLSGRWQSVRLRIGTAAGETASGRTGRAHSAPPKGPHQSSDSLHASWRPAPESEDHPVPLAEWHVELEIVQARTSQLGQENVIFCAPVRPLPYDGGGGAAKGGRSMKKKQQEPMPQGCRKCNGNPWIVDKGGMRRCTCPRGVYFQQRDRERAAKEVGMSL